MPGRQPPRVVIVTRSTEYERLIEHHATAGQARFFLRQRSLGTTEVERGHGRVSGSLLAVEQAIPTAWRRNQVQRAELDRFLFEPDDIVVAVGQDAPPIGTPTWGLAKCWPLSSSVLSRQK